VAMTLILKRLDEAQRECRDNDLQRAVLRTLSQLDIIPEESLAACLLPYSLSPVLPAGTSSRGTQQRPGHGSRTDPMERRVRLRMSWLEDARLGLLLRWAQGTGGEPVPVQGDGCRARIAGVRVHPTPADGWNRSVSYAELFSAASDSLKNATLKFCSPTLLLREGVPYPLPDPVVIFQQYLDLWDRFSGIPLAGGLPSILRESVLLVDFRLRARPADDGMKTDTCFSGSASFRLQGRHPETVLKGFNTLADFAFFCGTGTGTEQGRGMTRRILPGAREPERRSPAWTASHVLTDSGGTDP